MGHAVKLFITFIFPLFVKASSLGVWPINPRIDSPASATLVWVKNNNKSEPVVLQARIFLWRQEDNNDITEAQDELVVSPPIIEVKPDAQQIFRVMNRKGIIQDVTVEKSYRLLIDEVPKEGENQGSTLRFQMRYSLPLFVGTPKGSATTEQPEHPKKMAQGLHYRIIQEPTPVIEIINQSPLHTRLSNLAVNKAEAIEKYFPFNKGLLGYVLPNSMKRWPLNSEQLAALTEQNIAITFEQDHQELIIDEEK